MITVRFRGTVDCEDWTCDPVERRGLIHVLWKVNVGHVMCGNTRFVVCGNTRHVVCGSTRHSFVLQHNIDMCRAATQDLSCHCLATQDMCCVATQDVFCVAERCISFVATQDMALCPSSRMTYLSRRSPRVIHVTQISPSVAGDGRVPLNFLDVEVEC